VFCLSDPVLVDEIRESSSSACENSGKKRRAQVDAGGNLIDIRRCVVVRMDVFVNGAHPDLMSRNNLMLVSAD